MKKKKLTVVIIARIDVDLKKKIFEIAEKEKRSASKQLELFLEESVKRTLLTEVKK